MTTFDYEPLTLKQPGRYMLRMLGFLLITGFIVWLVQEPLVRAIGANPLLNIGIIAVLLVGILFTFGQILNLRPEIKWLNKFNVPGASSSKPPKLLGPMARLLGNAEAAYSLSHRPSPAPFSIPLDRALMKPAKQRAT